MTDARAAAETVARHHYGRLLAILARRSADVAGAEDALADAFAAALAVWPRSGVPRNPEGWLLTAARRRRIDDTRRAKTFARMEPHLVMLADEWAARANTTSDERLGLMFACAHPAIDASVRAPLILQTVLGFDASTIASAFLVSPAAMAQRLMRAKAKIRQARISFAVPDTDERASRLDAVLAAIYSVFSEGWADPAGTEPRRRGLSQDAIWLGRLVVDLLPDEAEGSGLLALMLFAEARRAARRTHDGVFVPLDEQDVALWNAAMIDEAEALLRRAGARAAIGRYQIEAAIQSAHAVRRSAGRADWAAILTLYDALVHLTGSPVAQLNRAVATAHTNGAEAALAAISEIQADPRLADYQPFWATKADLFARAGRHEDAQQAYRRAIGLERDPAIRAFLQGRHDRLAR